MISKHKSYAGIGDIFTYILSIYDYIIHLGEGIEFPGNVLNLISMILLLGLPFFLTFATIPSLLVIDITKKHQSKYIRSIGKKIGIRNEVKISVELKSYEPD